MRNTNGWVNALFALVFIATPALVGFFLWVPYWEDAHKEPTWFYYVVALGFLVYVSLFSWLLIKFEWLGIDSLNFNIPIALVFAALFVSYDWAIWLKVLVTVFMVLMAFPVNMWTTNFRKRK